MAVVKQKRVRKILTQKMRQLYDIVADMDTLLTEMETDFYRVCIFGSARIGPDSKIYQQVEDLAEGLAKNGLDVVTGGGPGLMEAANKGAKKANQGGRSLGLTIELPFESDANSHLDVKSQHRRFSSRLDEFMRLSHAVELFYTWQLMQVNHIKPRPFLLLAVDDTWTTFMEWLREHPLKQNLMSQSDMDAVKVVSSVEEVLAALEPDIARFRAENKLQR
jgi:predicted Rossmann-fold nucleotide-binding protein